MSRLVSDINHLASVTESGLLWQITENDFETKTGKKIAAAVLDLFKRYTTERFRACGNHKLEVEIHGLRNQNEALTKLLESKEAQIESLLKTQSSCMCCSYGG